uniref:Uncharacterized protein n=1 Tax=Anguilla anguilla TaxID=7936 RepID=A0A0E9RF58_ANGAN
MFANKINIPCVITIYQYVYTSKLS